MKRNIIMTTGEIIEQEVGSGYQAWNEAIGARMGEVVVTPDGTLELWCDEEGMLIEEPVLNTFASMLAGRQIVGDCIAFFPGDIK